MEPSATPLPSAEQPNLPTPPELSEREVEVLRLVATGAGNKEIAQRLVISPNTVKVHVRNIFTKIGAASRTEATLYAIRNGLVQIPGGSYSEELRQPLESQAPAISTDLARQIRAEHADGDGYASRGGAYGRRAAPRLLWQYLGLFGSLILVLVFIASEGSVRDWLSSDVKLTPTSAITSTPANPGWENGAAMPTARSGFGIAVYENQIYSIAGQTMNGVTGIVERYDATANSWETLAAKPIPVADVGAGVIGGRIYVPGGRLASGVITRTLEVYDPRENTWVQRAPVPIPISAYALTTFEGKLYVFGGWDGTTYQATVFEYDPGRDLWQARTPMPYALGFAGAVSAGNTIYVLGGIDNNNKALAINVAYQPNLDAQGEYPWETRKPMPIARYGMGVTSLADMLYVFGGKGSLTSPRPVLYVPQENTWQLLDNLDSPALAEPGLVALGTQLHACGGLNRDTPVARHWVYRALVTISIPAVVK